MIGATSMPDLGLGESLFHYAGYSGHSPADAQAAFERTIQLDSAMAPIYDHLVDLALLAGDSTRAVTYVRGMSSNDPGPTGTQRRRSSCDSADQSHMPRH